jgi:hypothetical protein
MALDRETFRQFFVWFMTDAAKRRSPMGSRRPQPPDDGQPGTLGAPHRLTVIDQAGDVVVEILDDRAFEVATGRPLYLRGNGLFTSSRSGLVYVISNGAWHRFPDDGKPLRVVEG